MDEYVIIDNEGNYLSMINCDAIFFDDDIDNAIKFSQKVALAILVDPNYPTLKEMKLVE